MTINIDQVKVPVKIDPCPIINARVEFRFDPSVADNDVIGIVYKEFNKDYPVLKGLPGLQIPKEIIKDDKELLYAPYYELSSKDGKRDFKIGARSFSLVSSDPYEGWSSFYKRIKDIAQRMGKLLIFEKYKRVGILYANKFDTNIFDVTDIFIKVRNDRLGDLETNINFALMYKKFTNRIRVANNVNFKKKGEVTSKGSLIEIATYTEDLEGDIMGIVDDAHLVEKKVFFTLLNDNFIKKQLKPEY